MNEYMSNFCALIICFSVAVLHFSFGNIALGLFCILAGLINLPYAINWLKSKR